MARRKNTRRFDPRYFMDEKTDIIKEGTDSSGHIDAWLIRIVAGLANFRFDPNKQPPQSKFGKRRGRGAYEVWQEQQGKVANAIRAINSGKYTAEQLQSATKMASSNAPPQVWIMLAGEVAGRPEPLTTMGKIKGMFGLEEIKEKQ